MIETAVAKREPSLKGAPSFFRALVRDASCRRVVGVDLEGRNARLDYGAPGHELARHIEDYLFDDAAEEWNHLAELTDRAAREKAERAFVAREFPGCLALIPPKRRERFFEGFFAYFDE